MISINIKKNKKFSTNNHLAYFYAITDVYQNKGQPINDTQMVNILKEEYGLDIERRTIKRYRDFLKENFDINLIYYKKGYYIDNRTDDQKEIDTKVNVIQSAMELEHRKALNIIFKNQSLEIYPLEINIINDEEYLLGICEKANGDCVLKNLKINNIRFNKPLYVDFDCKMRDIRFEELLYSKFSFEKDMLDIPYNDPYEINTTLVFKKNSPIKVLRKEIKSKFTEVKNKYFTIDGEIYKAVSFCGDSLEVSSFVIRNRRYLKKVIGEGVKDEIRVMFGIH